MTACSDDEAVQGCNDHCTVSERGRRPREIGLVSKRGTSKSGRTRHSSKGTRWCGWGVGLMRHETKARTLFERRREFKPTEYGCSEDFTDGTTRKHSNKLTSINILLSGTLYRQTTLVIETRPARQYPSVSCLMNTLVDTRWLRQIVHSSCFYNHSNPLC